MTALEAVLDFGLPLMTLLVLVIQTLVSRDVRTDLTTEEFGFQSASDAVMPFTTASSGASTWKRNANILCKQYNLMNVNLATVNSITETHNYSLRK